MPWGARRDRWVEEKGISIVINHYPLPQFAKSTVPSNGINAHCLDTSPPSPRAKRKRKGTGKENALT